MELKLKWSKAKNEVRIWLGLQHEKCYLEGVRGAFKNMVRGGVY